MKIRFLHLPLYAPEAGAGGGGVDAGAAAAAAAAAAGGGAKPWYDGVDAETIGHWDNKGWKKDDAKEIALAATKQAREAEKHFGVPADQLLKMPKADAKPEDIKAFWGKLGAPGDAKEYDFSTVKLNGAALPESIDAALRASLAQAFVPKDKATGIAAGVAKALESAKTSEDTLHAGKIAEEKALLEKNWGTGAKFEANRIMAEEGARRLGIAPDAVKALEGTIGYAGVMEAMRKIGTATSEDTFIERGATGGGIPHTREGAVSRKAELMADTAWAGRYLKGGVAEAREMNALNQMIDGANS